MNCLPRSPCLADVGVIALVPAEWETPWQPRHQILTRLSQYFHVVWCDPAQSWREVWPRSAPREQGIEYGSVVPPGFTVYHPERWLPQFGRPQFLAHWTLQARLRHTHFFFQAEDGIRVGRVTGVQTCALPI